MDGSLNDIKLNGTLMGLLYARSLVDVNDNNDSIAAPSEPPAEVRFLGNNAKNITVLVNDPGNTFMPEGHLAFLTKILGACKLNIGDVAIVNTAHTSDINSIITILKPAKAFAFGINVTISGVDHVKAPAIGELVPETDEAKEKKARLWGDLKRLLML